VIRAGLAAARWPGRLERRHWNGRELLLDGAHNPPAAAALRREVDRIDAEVPRSGRGRRWLVGIQRHKEGPEVLRHLLRAGDQAAIVPIQHHVSWSAAELSEALPSTAAALFDVAGLEEGLTWLAAPGPLPVVTGSLHLIGALLPRLDRSDARLPPGR
jgi:dihydrofolate synthase/folylpolyglutamate synthase